jgi:hypothetical protein
MVTGLLENFEIFPLHLITVDKGHVQHNMYKRLYLIYYGNEGASSSISDVDRYTIIRNLLDFIVNIQYIGIHTPMGNSNILMQGFFP